MRLPSITMLLRDLDWLGAEKVINKIVAKGFRILHDFEWQPCDGINILVGANSIGKSTVLNAIELVTRCSLHGQPARFALSPDWFNADDVEAFFNSLSDAGSAFANPPEILISVTFRDEPSLAGIKGCQGPEGAAVNAPGLLISFSVPVELQSQFTVEAKTQLENGGNAHVIPTDYYKCTWKSFKGDTLMRRPRGISCSRVNTEPAAHSKAIDSYAKGIICDELSEEKLRDVSSRFRELAIKVDRDVLEDITICCGERDSLGLQIDKSPRTDWKNSIVLHRGGLPLAALGSAEQILTKCSVSLSGADQTSLLLLEEPECHLSHTSLNELIAIIDRAAHDGRQVFVTTHSPIVLNRLGLDRLFVMSSSGHPIGIGDLTDNTVRYFKRISGCDTLRIALADKSVLVEGPTDEMVFDWAFRKMRGCLPWECGIDVIECGIQHRRLLEFAHALDKKNIVALRDNDGQQPQHWVDKARPYLSDGRQFFCGACEGGHTIEPQMINANLGRLDLLARSVGCDDGTREGLEQYMADNKTEWALSLLEKDVSDTRGLSVPPYISDAINFIVPKLGGESE